MSGLESQLPALLLFLASASVLAVATQRWLRAPYTVALTIVGLAFGTLGVTAPVELSSDLVIFVLLPALQFEGVASIDYGEIKTVLPVVVSVALVLGLPETAVLAPSRKQIRAMVFGVGLAGLLVQAISLPWLIRALDVGESTAPVGEFEWAEAE